MKNRLWNEIKRVLAMALAVAMLTTVVYVNDEPEVMPLVDFEEEYPVHC